MIETVIVESNWRDALGNPISGSVQITPVAEFVTSSGSGSFRISGSTVFASIVNGAFSVSLIPTDDATPAGQYYSVRTFIGGIQHVTAWIVPTTSAVLSIADVEVSPPPPIPILSSGDAISLRGLSIKAALSPADGYVLTWVAANNRFETLAAAVSGAPAAATFITQTPHAGLSAEQALSSLATGLLKNTTVSGELSVAVPGTDFEAPLGYTPLDPANDLSDVADAPTARTNLGLGDAAVKNTGAIAGTVAAGDDARFASDPEQTVVLSAPVTLSSAQLLDLHNTPVELIPAPGAGKAIVPMGPVSLQYIFGTKPYPRSGDAFIIGYGDTQLPYILDSFTDWAASIFRTAFYYIDSPGVADPSDQALKFSVAGSLADGVETSSTGSGGSGYAVFDQGYVDAGNQNARFTITAVDGGGAVTAYDLNYWGSGYSVASAVATETAGSEQPGVGTGLTIDILTLTAGDGTLTVTVPYSIITLQ